METEHLKYVGDCGTWGQGYCRALGGCKTVDRPTSCLTGNEGGRCKNLATCPNKPTEEQLKEYQKASAEKKEGDE